MNSSAFYGKSNNGKTWLIISRGVRQNFLFCFYAKSSNACVRTATNDKHTMVFVCSRNRKTHRPPTTRSHSIFFSFVPHTYRLTRTLSPRHCTNTLVNVFDRTRCVHTCDIEIENNKFIYWMERLAKWCTYIRIWHGKRCIEMRRSLCQCDEWLNQHDERVQSTVVVLKHMGNSTSERTEWNR